MTGDDVSPEALLNAAREAARNAYAPYSDFFVGAALLTEAGDIVTGCNVENVSYGLTVCAERVAVMNAVSQGKRRFQALAVWAARRPHGDVTPCGACRQVLSEFLAADAPVYFPDAATGELRMLTMAALLPEAFAPGFDSGGNCPDTGSSIRY